MLTTTLELIRSEFKPGRHVRDGDCRFLGTALGGASAARIALQLGRTKNTVDSALARLRDGFTARDRAQRAAAALLNGSVDYAATDPRFPPLSAILTRIYRTTFAHAESATSSSTGHRLT
ncbi:hypothetical protein ACH41E_24200 [Streptomyces sp. NPDC020412]|uniref:hypothetical protein n=1 Tax=Streptomyces sp. NPDC020412 TaxID=3365073 RepID=UPI00379BEA21